MASVLSAFPSWWSYLCVLVCVDTCVLCMSRWIMWESRAMTEWPSWLKNSTLWNWSVCLAVSFLCCVHCWSVSAWDQSSPQAQCEIRQWFVHWLWLEDFWLLCGLTQADVIFSQCVFCDLVRLLHVFFLVINCCVDWLRQTWYWVSLILSDSGLLHDFFVINCCVNSQGRCDVVLTAILSDSFHCVICMNWHSQV